MVNNSTKIKPRVKNFKLPKANYTKLQNYKKVIKIDEIINQNSSIGFEQKQVATAKFGNNEGKKIMNQESYNEVEKPFTSDMAVRDNKNMFDNEHQP